MMIGARIRTIREQKGITAKDMAAELDMSITGYSKIERDEVDINTEKIEKIANKLGVKPYELLLEERIVLYFANNTNSDNANGNYGFFNTMGLSDEMKKLYEANIRLLEEKIDSLQQEKKTVNDLVNLLKAENEQLKAESLKNR